MRFSRAALMMPPNLTLHYLPTACSSSSTSLPVCTSTRFGASRFFGGQRLRRLLGLARLLCQPCTRQVSGPGLCLGRCRGYGPGSLQFPTVRGCKAAVCTLERLRPDPGLVLLTYYGRSTSRSPAPRPLPTLYCVHKASYRLRSEPVRFRTRNHQTN